MSSLGAKVKEFLHAGDSEEAKRGEVDRNTPGSFPADDVQSAEQQRAVATGHEHHRLHKSNDPRGWTEGPNTPRDSAYQASDVGFGEARTQPSYDTTQQSTLSRLEKPRDAIAEPNRGTAERFDESTASRGLESSADAAPGQHSHRSTEPTVPSADAQEHPYWGDLPLNSVQQSIPGHDAAHGEGRYHNNPAATAPLESGRFTNRRDPPESAHFSSTQRGDQQQSYESASGSHFKEDAGAGSGAVVAGAGAGAYELNKKHRTNENSERVEPATSSTQPQEHKGRSFPLMNRDHRDREDDAHHPKEKQPHHTRGVQEDRHLKEPKPERESKLGVLSHKGHKDETKPELQGDGIEDKHHRSETSPALATAGVGGATAYAATRDRHGEHQPQDVATTKQLKDDKRAKEAKPKHDSKIGGLFHRSHKDKGEVDPAVRKDLTEDKYHKSKAAPALATAGAAGAATYTATRDRHDSHQPQDTATASRYDKSTAHQAAGQHFDSNHPAQADHHSGTTQLPIASQFTSASKYSDISQRHVTGQTSTHGESSFQDAQAPDHCINNSPAQGYQPEGSHSHRDTKLTTGAAAGLGAGALASHELNKRQNDKHALENTPSHYQSGQTASLGTEPLASQGLDERQLNEQYTAGDTSRQYQSGQHLPGQSLDTETFVSRGLDNRPSNVSYPSEDTSRQYQPGQFESVHTGSLGTGNFESFGLKDGRQSDQYTPQTDSRQYEADQTGSVGSTSLVDNARASGLGSPRKEPVSRSVEPTQRRGDDGLPIFTQNANAGKYNTLASGTPAGLRTED